MTEDTKPAFLVVCGTALEGEIDPKYGELAGPLAQKAGLTPIGGGAIGTAQVEVLEGELPPGATILAVEQFPSMAALKEFYFSDGYQRAIAFRTDAMRMNFLVAIDGISAADLQAQAQAAESK